MKKKRNDTKPPRRELHISELDRVCGGSIDVPAKPPVTPWPQ